MKMWGVEWGETQGGELQAWTKAEIVGLDMKELTGEIVREKTLQVALPESRRIHRVSPLRAQQIKKGS